MRLSFLLALALCAACGDGVEPVPFQGVSGKVTFLGTPPDSTEWVRIGVYRQIPDSTSDLLPPNLVAFSDTVSLGLAEANYLQALEPGGYGWLVVAWKEQGNDNLLEALRAAGWYSADDTAFGVPASFRVAADSETAGINVIADFENMLTIAEVLEALR